MKYVSENKEKYLFPSHPIDLIGTDLDFKGVIYRIKNLGKFSFIHIFVPNGLVQCVCSKLDPELKEGSSVLVSGSLRLAKIKDTFIHPQDVEVQVRSIQVISSPKYTFPFDISKRILNIKNDILFDYRMLSMRHPYVKAIFKIQEGLVQGFREYFMTRYCTEIRSPKIVKEGAEGGANIFEIEYFGEKAYLTQSPQFYKEFCTGVYQRVFEIGPVFRAEKYNTNRHVNEYTSVDVELGNIEDFYEIMKFEIGALKRAFENISKNYQYELRILEISIPDIYEIPVLKFSEVKEILKNENKKESENFDLSPEDEKQICEYILKETGSEFLFVTHYPSSKRPFYTMDNPKNKNETLSFDLLFRGVEITTGGQRIHNYEELVSKMKTKGMNPTDFEFFSVVHKHGILPHGGFGMGLERLTQKLIGLESVKLSSMFPRDLKRLAP